MGQTPEGFCVLKSSVVKLTIHADRDFMSPSALPCS